MKFIRNGKIRRSLKRQWISISGLDISEDCENSKDGKLPQKKMESLYVLLQDTTQILSRKTLKKHKIFAAYILSLISLLFQFFLPLFQSVSSFLSFTSFAFVFSPSLFPFSKEMTMNSCVCILSSRNLKTLTVF